MSDETTVTMPEPAPRPKRRVLRRVLTGIGLVLGTLVTVGALLFLFGTMQPPSAAARAAYDQAVAAGQVPAAQARFGVPVPGCVCHSDDPVLQVEHSTHYIRECSGCHSR